MDFTIETKDLISILMSVICGGIIGLEREYKHKSAGFRTIVLITLGSTIFTIASRHGLKSDDRIAANIITGIGFIGAGVIFKDQFSVRGLTTAAVIWTSAAIGMTVGIGYHALALLLTVVTMCILLLMNRVEKMVSLLQKQRRLNVTFRTADFEQVKNLEEMLSNKQLIADRLQVSKDQDTLTVVWHISGKKAVLLSLNEVLANMPSIISFK
ncbi:MgtC/SapB family protein [Mucilaginibacter gynuensis]|uniref:MgtC/SapB family protein n=1 Tax=Mucilaginibacter gynuensis TaxID=1302236 RepID=A0ABP8G3T1_9SPHI